MSSSNEQNTTQQPSSEQILRMIITGENYHKNYRDIILPFVRNNVKFIIRFGERKSLEEVINIYNEKKILNVSDSGNRCLAKLFTDLWTNREPIKNKNLLASLRYTKTDQFCSINEDGTINYGGNIILGKYIHVSYSSGVVYCIDENFICHHYSNGIDINPVLFEEVVTVHASSGAVYKIKNDTKLVISYNTVWNEIMGDYFCVEKHEDSIGCYQLSGKVDVVDNFPNFHTYFPTKYNKDIDPFFYNPTPVLHSITTNCTLPGFSEEEISQKINSRLIEFELINQRILEKRREALVPQGPPPLIREKRTSMYLTPPPLKSQNSTVVNLLQNMNFSSPEKDYLPPLSPPPLIRNENVERYLVPKNKRERLNFE